jgi:hypothetical protein
MFGDAYLQKIASATWNEMAMGLGIASLTRLRAYEHEGFAARLAAAIPMQIFNEPAPDPVSAAFRVEHERRIADEIKMIVSDENMCEVLSGGAYNVAYGRYIKARGSRIKNNYFSYILADASDAGSDQALLIAAQLNTLDRSILRPIYSLKASRGWHPGPGNPNEKEYYERVHQFAVSVGVAFKA